MLLYGFGYNGFRQIASNASESIFVPVIYGAPAGNISSCDFKKNMPLIHPCWESTLYIDGDDIIMRGCCNKNDSSQLSTHPIDMNLKSEDKILDLAHCQNFIGILTKSKEMYLCKVSCIEEESPVLKSCTLEFKDRLVDAMACSLRSNKWIFVSDRVLRTIEWEVKLKKFNLLPEIELKQLITQVSCGIDHCLALTESGKTFSWGLGSRGQLGHGHLANLEHPQLVEALDGVTIRHVCCGGWHSVALAETNDLYTWGWNESGQTGFPAPKHVFSTSTNMETIPKHRVQCSEKERSQQKLETISTGNTNKLPEEKQNHLSSSGGGDREQERCQANDSQSEPTELMRQPSDSITCEQYEPIGMLLSPMLLELEGYIQTQDEGFVSIVDVACGSRHTAAVTSNNDLVTWGWGKYGQLGHDCCVSRPDNRFSLLSGETPCENTVHRPSAVSWFFKNRLRCHKVSCGSWNTFVFTDSS